jgi:hypothetical protein
MSRSGGAPEKRLQRTSGDTDTDGDSLEHHFSWDQRGVAAF